MNDETHIITNISEPQNEVEKDTVLKIKVIAQLQISAIYSIAMGIASSIAVGSHLVMGEILPAVLCGIGLIGSGITTHGAISTLIEYQIGSKNSNIESEDKTR